MLASVDQPNDGWNISQCVKPLLWPRRRNSNKKLLKKQVYSSSVIDSIIFAVGVFFSYPLLAWTVRCWSSSITEVMVLQLFATHLPAVRILLILVHLALCHCQIVESPNISFLNASFINTVVSLGVFFRRTQNLIMKCCSTNTSIFSEYSVIHCPAIYEYSALYAHFFLSSNRLLYTSAPTLSCILLAEKIVFPLFARTIIHYRGTAICFLVTSYISPLVRRTAVSMHSLES